MSLENQELLSQIESYKKLILNTKEEKLRIEMEINSVSKSLKEFNEKKEARRRELLNELIPVREEDFQLRNVVSAPNHARRAQVQDESPMKNIRNVVSADGQL